MKHTSLRNNVVYLYILQAINVLLPLFSLPYLFSTLGTKGFGIFIYAYTFMIVLNYFVDFGFELYGSNYVAIHKQFKKKVQELFSSVFLTKSIIVIVVILSILICSCFIDIVKDNTSVFLFMSLLLIGNAISPIWLFQGLEEMKAVTLIGSSAKILAYLPMFFLVKDERNLELAATIFGLAYLIAGISSFLYAKLLYPWLIFKINKTRCLYHIQGSSQFFISRLSVLIYQNGNILIIGSYLGEFHAGVYAAAEKLYQGLLSLINPIVVGLYPHISSSKNLKLYWKIFIFTIAISYTTLAFTIINVEYILEILFNEEVHNILMVQRMLIFTAFITIPSSLIGMPLLAAIGYKKQAIMSTIYGGIFYVIAVFSLNAWKILNLQNLTYLYFSVEGLVLTVRIYFVYKFKIFKSNDQ